MDGVVVVVAHSGALHFTRSFSACFDRRHAKSDRMNLAALLFALQNVAADSIIHSDDDGGGIHSNQADDPAITLFETALERIVMAQSRSQGLLIALFVRPHLDAAGARSLVRRIAHHYDHDHGTDMRPVVALNQSARIFREACEHAVQDQVDACLHEYAASLYAAQCLEQPPTSGFVLLHFEDLSAFDRSAGDDHSVIGRDAYDEDDYEDDTLPANGPSENIKESRLASPRLTQSSSLSGPRHRLQKLYASIRSLPPQPTSGASRTSKPKKNAVMHHADPKRFQRCVLFPRAETDSEDAQTQSLSHRQFTHALVDALQPTAKQLATLIAPATTKTSRTLVDGTWRNFPLPSLLLATATSNRVAVDLRFWIRGGCLLVYIDTPPQPQGTSAKAMVSALLDRVEPLARCAVRISK